METDVPTLVVDAKGVTASSTSAAPDAAPATQPPASAGDMCKACHKAPIEFMSSTCSHPLYCRKCAMKCATGGKCKTCGSLFPDLRRI